MKHFRATKAFHFNFIYSFVLKEKLFLFSLKKVYESQIDVIFFQKEIFLDFRLQKLQITKLCNIFHQHTHINLFII